MFSFKSKQDVPASARLTRRMLLIIPVLAVAVLCYAFSAVAWFQASLINGGNTIRVGNFAADVALVRNEEAGMEADNVLWQYNGSLVDGSVDILLTDAPATAYLRVASASSSTLKFQYQLTLSAGDQVLLHEVPQGEDKLELVPVGSPDGDSEVYYEVDLRGLAAGTLHLEFRASFLANSMSTLTTAATTTAANRAPANTTTTTAAATTTTAATTAVSGTDGESTTAASGSDTTADTANTTGETSTETTASTGAGDSTAPVDTGTTVPTTTVPAEEEAAGGETTPGAAADETAGEPTTTVAQTDAG